MMRPGTTTKTQNKHQQRFARKSEPTLSPIGSRVSAKFYGDDLFYSAIVLGHENGRCSVVFEGYEDDEPQWTSPQDVRDLKLSIEPQPARMLQTQRRANRATRAEKQLQANDHSDCQQKYTRKLETSLFPVGSRVSAKFYGDGLFYHAIVYGHDNGRYSIVFEGYEDDKPQWTSAQDVNDLKISEPNCIALGCVEVATDVAHANNSAALQHLSHTSRFDIKKIPPDPLLFKKLIGPKGDVVQQISKETGVHIEYCQETHTCRLSGPNDRREAAWHRIELIIRKFESEQLPASDALHSQQAPGSSLAGASTTSRSEHALRKAGTVSKELPPIAGLIGRLVGTNGAVVKSMESASGAFIRYCDASNSCHISGTADATERAWKAIDALVQKVKAELESPLARQASMGPAHSQAHPPAHASPHAGGASAAAPAPAAALAQPAAWSVFTDAGPQPYSPADSAALEAAFGRLSALPVPVVGGMYEVDVLSMEQRNRATGFLRSVLRIPPDDWPPIANPRADGPSGAAAGPPPPGAPGGVAWGGGAVRRGLRAGVVRYEIRGDPGSGDTREVREYNMAFAQCLRLHGGLAAGGAAPHITQVDVYENAALAAQFKREQGRLQRAGAPAGETWVFHGTGSRENVVSIMCDGFKVGGGADGIPIANGAAYGSGVYTAKGPNTPMSYGRQTLAR